MTKFLRDGNQKTPEEWVRDMNRSKERERALVAWQKGKSEGMLTAWSD